MKTKGLLMIVFLIGMFFSAQAADHVKGNGKLSTKKITIDDFNAIKFDGVIDFNYEQSESTPHIEITVDENLHPVRGPSTSKTVFLPSDSRGQKSIISPNSSSRPTPNG